MCAHSSPASVGSVRTNSSAPPTPPHAPFSRAGVCGSFNICSASPRALESAAWRSQRWADPSTYPSTADDKGSANFPPSTWTTSPLPGSLACLRCALGSIRIRCFLCASLPPCGAEAGSRASVFPGISHSFFAAVVVSLLSFLCTYHSFNPDSQLRPPDATSEPLRPGAHLPARAGPPPRAGELLGSCSCVPGRARPDALRPTRVAFPEP